MGGFIFSETDKVSFETKIQNFFQTWLAGFKRNEPHRGLESHPRDRFTVGQEI